MLFDLKVNLTNLRSVLKQPNENLYRVFDASEQQLGKLIDRAEKLVDVKVASIRAIDSRSLSLLLSLGFVVSVIFIGVDDSNSLNRASIVSLVFSSLSAILNFLIIRSAKISSIGNDGLALLNDICEGYSERQADLDYVICLSNAIARNDAIIARNGLFLFWAGLFVLIALIAAIASRFI